MLADKLGLVTDGLSNAKPVPGPGKPRKPRNPRGKDPVREMDREKEIELEIESSSESESECSEDERDIDYEWKQLMKNLRQIYTPQISPSESILNKVTSAFLGYPVMTHVSEEKPGNTKLAIEIDI